MEMKDEPESPISNIIFNLIPEIIGDHGKQIRKSVMSFGAHRWESFYSKQIEFQEMTSEKNPNFKILQIDDRLVIGWKILRLFECMSSVELQAVKEQLRTYLSL